MATNGLPPPRSLLGYLLKHGTSRMAELYARNLDPLGVTAQELGVLLSIAEGEPPSQQEVALRLGVDRTTMVAVLDVLEGKALLSRRPSTDDRRRNVIALTTTGKRVLRAAVRASAKAEAAFLESLDPASARRFREDLRLIVTTAEDVS